MITSFYNGKVIATFLFDDNCNKSIFEVYIQAILIKDLTLDKQYYWIIVSYLFNDFFDAVSFIL
ncbi:hypothetical protein OTSGILL_0028 [Orientia tsutsugamushi str. Gilliam]|uniref:IS630 family transposase n=1 Tax=Orientia tsutsugamushi str. Gilliam TaxID=1359184 RepID=A0A0F3MF61_ORITS|nr:hypothetical protein OTSGILL_0028 [Orientia tsutsugamushi str. Gilliam]SPR13185.1 IS630 family transposase [Orientia tsutsugamushi str. Gilliam]